MSAVCFFSVAFQAKASAPKQTTGNPGYYRFELGDFEVNVISDGTFDLPTPTMLSNVSPKEVKADLEKNFLGDKFQTSVNAFLINTGTKLVLIDSGAGALFVPTVGKFHEHLLAAGYKPEQIDAIVITHMHGDHIGGLTKDGKILFPNASLYISKADVDYWMSKDQMAKAPADKKKFFADAMAAIGPWQKSGQLKPMTDDIEITSGIRAVAAHGHTPGHTDYSVESKGQKLLLIGDLVHVGAVQFEKPSARMAFDSDVKMAEKQREMVFADAAKKGYLIGAAHLAFPGIGHLRAEKKGYTFFPINYTR